MIEDRVAKEQARRKAEQEEEELKAAKKVGFQGQRNSKGGGGVIRLQSYPSKSL